MATPLFIRIRDRVYNLSTTTEINLNATAFNYSKRIGSEAPPKESCVILCYGFSVGGEGAEAEHSILFGDDAQAVREFFRDVKWFVPLREGTV
jgi:hypothetical protein